MSTPAPISDLARRPLLDLRTTFLIVVMATGFPLVGWAFHVGLVPIWAAFVLGTLLMNLSFTAWHEPCHGNLSSSKTVNTAAGVFASFASVYPGYFARRREHLIHHRYEGQPEDPVYPRIQSSAFGFLLTLFKVAVFGDDWNEKIPATYLPRTRSQRISDALSNLISVALCAFSVYAGFWLAILAVWIVPRFVVLLAHAYTVCFFPHSVAGGGYVLYRVRPGLLLWLLTSGQNLHGIHHKWPAVPWYYYRKVLREHSDALEAAGVERL